MIICTIPFASDGALHIVGLSFLKSILITVTVMLSLCSFGIRARKFNGNSGAITVAKSEEKSL